ncbi:DNA repair protein RAD51 homolog 2 isoform X2 [Brienomyrus brachyistius]|uniref:DNA repair protein RAD51 homolog 2 isoform X2 n=1 Tax=Brienomyrus brachyistius TaxID=42636 RepID=UPI0020B2959E|nr:DNA repair protein RAD51 homolog 2 isoform X2 [Brienomyrus brachyistius]
MGSKKLRRTNLSVEICSRLHSHRIETCRDLLSLTPLEVMRVAGVSYSQACQLLKTTSQACAPKMTMAWELWRQKTGLYFPTSLAALDRLLQGGLACGTLTEVTGPSGCGKSQLCMMLSVLATLPHSMGGLDKGVLYIDTESAFSAERLVEIAQSRFPDYFLARERVAEMASRVHLFRELTCRDVQSRLQNLEEDIISCRAGLVVLDSVASVVVLTNQITTNLSDLKPATSFKWNSLEGSSLAAEDSGYVTAALGNTWSHSVNTRLIVQYVDAHCRQIIVAKSPVAPFAVFKYSIQSDGIRLEGDDDQAGPSHQGTDPGLQPIRVRSGFACNLTRGSSAIRDMRGSYS